MGTQTQLKDLNELHWERFKTALQAEGAAIRAELREEFRAGLADVRVEMAAMRANLLKWMFVYWSGTVVTLGALVVGMGMFGPG